MNKIKTVGIVAYAIHFVLLGTLILGVSAGNYLAKELVVEPTVIEKSNQ